MAHAVTMHVIKRLYNNLINTHLLDVQLHDIYDYVSLYLYALTLRAALYLKDTILSS